MRPIPFLVAALMLACPTLSRAGWFTSGPPAPPTSDQVVVVELFSSRACASCPAASAVLADLAQGDPAMLPLDLHVTYFDRAGWRDGDGLPAASQRQRRYVAQLRMPGVYTPQVVAGGRHEALGYDAHAVRAAVALAHGEAGGILLGLAAEGAGLRLRAGAGQGQGTLWLVGYDPPAGRHGGGVNTVRSLQAVGEWHGAAASLQVPQPLHGARTAVLLQDDGGMILAAAVLR